MKVILTRLSAVHPNHHQFTITDNNGNSIVVSKGSIPDLKRLLTKAQDVTTTGIGWKTDTAAYDAPMSQEDERKDR